MNEVTCNKCGWVHFAIAIKIATNDINNFNKMFDELSKNKKELYYGNKRATLDTYNHCSKCGNTYKDFKPAVEADAPAGATLQPILEYNNG